VSERSDHADGAVTAHAEVADVVKKDHASRAGIVHRFAKQGAYHHIRSPGLVHNCRPEKVVVGGKSLEPIREGVIAQVRAAGDYHASRLTGGVRIDNLDRRRVRCIPEHGMNSS
jgi:hypothetical protein